MIIIKKIIKVWIKKGLLIITETVVGSGLAINTSTMSIINQNIVIALPSSTALLTSIAILITNEWMSQLKISYTKLRDWTNLITILFEKAINQSLIYEKIDQKEADELKENHNHYLDKSNEIMKSTEFRVEDNFDYVISKDSISPEQKIKLDKFFGKIMWIIMLLQR